MPNKKKSEKMKEKTKRGKGLGRLNVFEACKLLQHQGVKLKCYRLVASKNAI